MLMDNCSITMPLKKIIFKISYVCGLSFYVCLKVILFKVLIKSLLIEISCELNLVLRSSNNKLFLRNVINVLSLFKTLKNDKKHLNLLKVAVKKNVYYQHFFYRTRKV